MAEKRRVNMQEVLKVENWPIERLVPYCRNPRKNDEQIDRMASAIREFGFRIPVVAKSDGSVVDGHLRLKAAQKLGLKEVPVALADELTEAQVKAFRLLANKSANWAAWDDDLLKLELSEIQDMAYDMSMTGFEAAEIEDLLGDAPAGTEGLTDADECPEVQETLVTQAGDIWLLGRHRLMCGDSTDAGSVALLMAGEKADMVFTDPPYGVNYEGGHFHSGDVNIVRHRERLANDSDDKIYEKVVPIIAKFCDGPCYTWFSDSRIISLYESVQKVGEIHALIIWHKINATYAAINAQYKQRHEPCLYWKPKGSSLRWAGPSNECTVWEIKRDAVNNYHPTQKPVELGERAIKNHDVQTVLDLFGGSGSTLIACEKIGRVCRMMELSPHYCDVIVKRWHDFTGEKATLESDGRDFETVAEERVA